MLHVDTAALLTYKKKKRTCGTTSHFEADKYSAERLPERLHPGRYDLFGTSHQIFHVFVLIGAGCQYAALRGMIWGQISSCRAVSRWVI